MRQADIDAMTPTEVQLWTLLGRRVWQCNILGAPRHLADEPLEKFGLKTLDALEIVLEAEQRFGVEIPLDALPTPMTIRAIAGTIDQILATRSPTP